MVVRVALVLLLATASACCAPPLPETTETTRDVVDLADNAVEFDDIVFSHSLGKLVVPARGAGVFVIDVDTLEAASLGGGDVASADANADDVVVLDRNTGTTSLLDPATGDVRTTAELGGDYVRLRPGTSETWVTNPAQGRIDVLTHDGDSFSVDSSISTGGGPEGLTFTDDGERAFAHTFAGDVLFIAGHTVESSHGMGCLGAHGIPAIDEDDGFVFGGCRGARIAALSVDDGSQRGSFPLETGGESLLAFSRTLGHAYVRGDPGTAIAVFDVDGEGSLALLGTVEGTEHGHCLTADDSGHVWTCDADEGAVVRIADPF